MQTLKRLGLAAAAAMMMMNTAGCLVMLDDAPPRWDGDHGEECFGDWDECAHYPTECECDFYGDCEDHDHDPDHGDHGDHDNNASPEPPAPGDPGEPVGDPNAPCDDPNPTAVCGEDGVTYMTPCDASRAHVRVAYTGSCKQACAADAECQGGELCEAGFCEEVTCPEIAEDDYSQEVCGNDDFTYQSACEARMTRVGVQHDGCCI